MPAFTIRFLSLLLFCFIFCLVKPSFAQNINNKTERPKIGLALSGGGAKGLAYIGLLKVIDSLGLKIDYISGTSAGGIFGGLYAMGYSADTLKKMALNINWKRVLSNKAPLNKINIEEKDEYDNYMIEFPVTNGRPRLPSSLIDGQYMSEVLNTLTYPAKHINNFNKLPIPITITSSDIVNGGLVLQNKGSLGMAIRATLAIPAAFSPVYIDGKLLVDGGLDRNFPVQEVRDMGADYVIGGYTGFRLFTEEEIENPMKLIYQTHAFRSVENSKQQMEMVNLLIDFTEPLRAYTTADFFKNKAIIEIGEREARKYIPQIKKLVEEQKKYQANYSKSTIVDPHLKIDKILYQNDKGQPLNTPVIEKFVNSRIGLKVGNDYDVKTINKGIENVYGSQFFNKVYYTFDNNADTSLTMNIRLKSGSSGVFKAGIHYDTEQSIGAIINYTYRNIFLRKSRLMATVDLSENYKARVDYYKFMNGNNRLWFKLSGTYKSLNDNLFIFKVLANGVHTSTLNADLSIGYSLNSASAIVASFSHEDMNIRTEANYIDRFSKDKNEKRSLYKHNNQAMAILFKQNSLDNAYYPKRGNTLTIQAKYFFNYRYKIKQLDLTSFNEENNRNQEIYAMINPTDRLTGNIFRFYLHENFVQPIFHRLSVNAIASWGFNSTQKVGYTQDLYANTSFRLGGEDLRYDIGQLNFMGMQRGELFVNNYTSFGLSLQYNPISKIYLSPQVNVILANEGLSPFGKREDDSKLIGYGVNLGYMSIIGPINFSMSKSTGFFEKSFRAYLSIGFKF